MSASKLFETERNMSFDEAVGTVKGLCHTRNTFNEFEPDEDIREAVSHTAYQFAGGIGMQYLHIDLTYRVLERMDAYTGNFQTTITEFGEFE